jgi:hypothetical protein
MQVSQTQAAHANLTLHAMHAHRLWIKLWITLGQPEENSVRPGGNAWVTERSALAVHSRFSRRQSSSHTGCVQRRAALPAQRLVIPGIHRTYDDYPFSITRQIHTEVSKRQATPTR